MKRKIPPPALLAACLYAAVPTQHAAAISCIKADDVIDLAGAKDFDSARDLMAQRYGEPKSVQKSDSMLTMTYNPNANKEVLTVILTPGAAGLIVRVECNRL